MSIPQLNVNPGEVSFFLQSGLLKDSVTIEASELNLKSLKDLACNFVDRKVSQSLISFICSFLPFSRPVTSLDVPPVFFTFSD